ncbi:hypothetical protein Trydic_g4398 [Trypoxylus dichotomus]
MNDISDEHCKRFYQDTMGPEQQHQDYDRIVGKYEEYHNTTPEKLGDITKSVFLTKLEGRKKRSSEETAVVLSQFRMDTPSYKD